MEYASEDSLQYVLHPLGAKAINGTKIRALSTGNPHEHDVLADGFGYLTGGVDPLCVGVNDDFSEHFGMVAVSSSAWISSGENPFI